jgi:integration host factor subunit alpha
MTLTKEAIIKSVFDRLDLSKATSANAVGATFEIIKKTLEGGADVLISGFGKFCVKDKGKRKGRDPSTGVDLMLAERRVVTFRCSGVLKRKVNGGQGRFSELRPSPKYAQMRRPWSLPVQLT